MYTKLNETKYKAVISICIFMFVCCCPLGHLGYLEKKHPYIDHARQGGLWAMVLVEKLCEAYEWF